MDMALWIFSIYGKKTSYEELAALSSYTLLTLRTNIHGFYFRRQYTLALVQVWIYNRDAINDSEIHL